MKWSAVPGTVLVFALLVTLHFTVRPLIGGRITPDFLVIAVLITAVRIRPGVAALVGFAIGLISDSLTPLAFGAGALALATVGFAASWLKALVFGDNLLLQATFIAAGKWIFDLLYLLVQHRMAWGDLLVQMAFWSPLSAAVTGLMGLLVVSLFRQQGESAR